MVELRRIRSGHFDETRACTLHDLEDAASAARQGNPEVLKSLIISPGAALISLPEIVIRDAAVDAVCHGASLARPGLSRYDEFKKGETVVLTSTQGELVALGRTLISSQEAGILKNGLVISPQRYLWIQEHTQRLEKRGYALSP